MPISENGFIYFIEMERPNLIKIGYAADVDQRLANLKTANPFELTVLDVFRGTKEDERKLQKIFKPYQYKREWFRPKPEIYDLLEDVFEYQVDTVCDTPLGDQRNVNAQEVLGVVANVPITGYWEWRKIYEERNG